MASFLIRLESYKPIPVLTHNLGTILEALLGHARRKDRRAQPVFTHCQRVGLVGIVTLSSIPSTGHFPSTLRNTIGVMGSTLLGFTFPLLGHPGS